MAKFCKWLTFGGSIHSCTQEPGSLTPAPLLGSLPHPPAICLIPKPGCRVLRDLSLTVTVPFHSAPKPLQSRASWPCPPAQLEVTSVSFVHGSPRWPRLPAPHSLVLPVWALERPVCLRAQPGSRALTAPWLLSSSSWGFSRPHHCPNGWSARAAFTALVQSPLRFPDSSM